MTQTMYRYRFDSDVEMGEVRQILGAAIESAQDLHGAAQIRQDFVFCADEGRHTLLVDGRTEAGQTVTRLFTGALLREFEESSFTVERIGPTGDVDLLKHLPPVSAPRAKGAPRPTRAASTGGPRGFWQFVMGGLRCW